jgi:hypothetical protein
MFFLVVLLFSIVVVIAVIPALVYLIIIKDSCLELISRIGYLSILYIVSIIVKGSYLELVA